MENSRQRYCFLLKLPNILTKIFTIMEKRLISVDNLLFPDVDGVVIFSAILDLDHYCLVIKREVLNGETARPFLIAVCIGGHLSYEGFDNEFDALRYAAVDIVKYIL